MIKAVLFDLDGTLVNSLEDLANSANYALSQFGFNTHKTEKFKYFIGDGMSKLIERILPEQNKDIKTHTNVLETFMKKYSVSYLDNTVAYEGIPQLISLLKEKGIIIAVISNKAEDMACALVKSIFGNSFNIVCGKREGYLTKPNPRLTLKIISELGLKAEECLFVGDSGMDAAVAKNAGCVGVGVLWGFRNKEELVKNGAQYIISHPTEILDIINEINEYKI